MRGLVLRSALPSGLLDGGDTMLMAAGGGLNFWVMPCGGVHIAWAASYPQEIPHLGHSKQDSLAHVQTMFSAFPQLCLAVLALTDPSSVVELPTCHRPPVTTWTDGKKATLLGDAAHQVRPGPGMGTTNAFLDALSLSAHLSVLFEPKSVSAGASADGCAGAGGDGRQIECNMTSTADVARALKEYEKDRLEHSVITFEAAAKAGAAQHQEDYADVLLASLTRSKAKQRETMETMPVSVPQPVSESKEK